MKRVKSYMVEKATTHRIFCMYCKGELIDKAEKKVSYHKSCKNAMKKDLQVTFLNTISEQLRHINHGGRMGLVIEKKASHKIKSVPENIALWKMFSK